MRNRMTAVLAIALLVFAVGGVADAALVAHYEFEGNANDSSGNGHHGTVTGTITYQAGVIGNAASCTADNNWISCGTAPGSADALTAAFWVNSNAVKYAVPLDKEPTGGTAGWNFKMRNDGGVWFRVGGNGQNTDAQFNPPPVAYQIGVWTHMAATYDNGLMILYVDGVEVARNTTVRTVNEAATQLTLFKPSVQTRGEWLDGMLDDVRIYDHAMSPAEVLALFNGVTPPNGSVSRTLPHVGVYANGTAVPVRLTATQAAGGVVVVTETMPAGLTPTNIVASAGTAPFGAGSITWTVDLNTTVPQTLDYDLVPNGVETVLNWTGSANAGPEWLTMTINGPNRMVGNKPLGIFDWWGDTGVGLPGATTNPSIVGASTSDNASSYTLTGAGADVWGNVDQCQVATKLVSGDFFMDGRLEFHDAGPNVWSKLGLMVRGSVAGNAAHAFEGIRNPVNNGDGGGSVVMQWRDNDGGGSGWTAAPPDPTLGPAWVRVVRTGNTVTGYYSLDGVTWLIDTAHTVPGLSNDEVLASIMVVSHQDNGLGAPPAGNAVFAIGEITSLTLTQIAVGQMTRTIGAADYDLGDVIPVTIDIGHLLDVSPLVIEETAPAGWVVLNASSTGTFVGNTVSWTIADFTTDTQVSYEVAPAGGNAKVGVFDGIVRVPGGVELPIGGDTQLNRVGGAPIVFISNTGHSAQDVNMVNAMGAAGITVALPAPQTLPGLGYPVWEINENAPEETQDFTSATARLILVSNTVGSPNPAYHQDEAVPIINSEEALNDNENPPRNEMYMSEGSGTLRPVTAITIVNNTHPITQLFPLGDLMVWEDRGNNPQLNLMTGAIGSGVIQLAHNPGIPAEPCLALYVAGTTDAQLVVPAAAQPFTAPAARLNLGCGANAFQYPTWHGAVLFQRAIQYMVGDPVTAGTPAPSRPTNLVAAGLPGAQVTVELTWRDNSSGEAGFVIGRSINGGSFIDIAEAGANATRWIDANVLLSQTTTYRVRAFNVAGDSANSNEAAADYRPRVSANATTTSLLLPARESQLLGTAVDIISGGIAVTTWSLVSSPGASTATLASPNALITTVTLNGTTGTYVFQFAAIDLLDQLATATVNILLYDLSNLPPVVDAGPDQQVGRPFLEPVVATLLGSVTDPLGQPTTATWSVLSTPPGGGALIADPGSAQTTVTLDNIIGGSYALRLTGTDGIFEQTDDVTLTVVFVEATSTRAYWQLME